MKVVYYYSQCLDDADAYSIRTKTRKEAVLLKKRITCGRFGPIVKVVVQYASGFDLLTRALGEGGLSEEYFAEKESKDNE